MTEMSGLIAAAARKRHACLILHNGEAQMKLLRCACIDRQHGSVNRLVGCATLLPA